MRNNKGQFVRVNSLVEGNCKVCGNKFVRESWRKGQILCSIECRALAKEGTRLKNWVQLICKSCGNQFEVTPARSSAVYCSRKCKGESMKGVGYWTGKTRESMVGDKNWAWKGGITKYPEYRIFMHKRYTLQKIKNGGSHSIDEWENLKKQYDFICLRCGKKEPEIKLTEDHIIPVILGGTDDIKNIQPLCGSCNSWKNKRFISFNPTCLLSHIS